MPPDLCLPPVTDPVSVTSCKTFDHFGARIATGGDWNGDGIEDLAVAGANHPSVSAFHGEVWLFLGTSSAPALRFTSSSAGSQFGQAVRFVKDLNGHDRDELLIAAPEWSTSGPTPTPYGRVYLLPGQADGSYTPGAERLAEVWAGAVFQGDVVGGHFGEAIAAGRIDAGSSRDLLIGAPGTEISDATPPPWAPNGYAGEVSLFSGDGAWVVGMAQVGQQGWSPPVLTPTGSAALILPGDQFLEPGDTLQNRFGSSLAVLGDVVPGAGGLEFAVGAPQVQVTVQGDVTWTGLGRVHVFSSTATEQVRLLGQQAGEGYGAVLDASVSFDGDSLPDLCVGANRYDHEPVPGTLEREAGRVWVLSGTSLMPIGTFFDLLTNNTKLIGAPNSYFGGAVRGVANMVGDSLSPPDILVGARDEFSSTFIPPGCTIAQGGRLAGAAYIVDGSDGSMPYKLIGERSKDHVGFDVAARDHDGDGKMDLVTAGLA